MTLSTQIAAIEQALDDMAKSSLTGSNALERAFAMRDAGRDFTDAANPAALRALLDERKRLREALQELLAVHTESAGMAPEIIANDVAFGDFMNECERRVKAATDKATAALKEE